MLIENESQYIDVNKIQSHNKLSQINNNNNYINQTGNKPIIKERNDEKEMKANNNLTISKEGDLLIQNIKANVISYILYRYVKLEIILIKFIATFTILK